MGTILFLTHSHFCILCIILVYWELGDCEADLQDRHNYSHEKDQGESLRQCGQVLLVGIVPNEPCLLISK